MALSRAMRSPDSARRPGLLGPAQQLVQRREHVLAQRVGDRRTDDPDVVVTEITHRGFSKSVGQPCCHTARGVIRVRDGEIVRTTIT
jgi:hypothetical protein